MTSDFANQPVSERLRIALDWAVFSAGVVALIVAIGATVASKSNTLNANAAPIVHLEQQVI